MQSSPALSAQSEDELFGRPTRPSGYETIETVPIQRVRDSSPSELLESLPPLPPSQRNQSQVVSNARQPAHPMQTIPESPSSVISSPPRLKPVVQVAASSPMNIPTMKKPSGILASAMAPAGTTFRRPVAPAPVAPKPPHAMMWFDDDGTESSDEEKRERERNSIKPKTFVRKSDTVTGQPSTFSEILADAFYKPGVTQSIHGVKRSADTMANAYGGVPKRPKQDVPARPVQNTYTPATEHDEVTIDDIRDPGLRNKVIRLRTICHTESVRKCLDALRLKHNNFDDAADYLLDPSPPTTKPRAQAIDLTGSGDELAPTPAIPRTKSHIAQATTTNRPVQPQPTKKVQSIAQKWSSTQQPPVERVERKLDVFDTPPPQPAVQKRRLVQGRRNRSPSPSQARSDVKKPIVVADDSGDDDDSGIHSANEDTSFDTRVLEFFNTCTALDLCDMSGIKMDAAEHIITKRPFKNMKAIHEIEAPNLKNTGKNRRAGTSLGERVEEKVSEMITSYEAVDFLVNKCQKIAQPLANSMKAWGVDVQGKNQTGDTGIDLVNVKQANGPSQASSHDSGIGTPISDDGSETNLKTGFLPQPKSLADGVVMKDYQVVGLNWLKLLFRHGVSGILADDMGLGKTLQTIAFIAHLKEIGENGPHLVIVPSATLENWLKEFQRFAPGLRVEPYYGSMEIRAEMRMRFDDEVNHINVIVTTYKIAKAKEDIPWLRNFGFTCAIFDEAHQLKNPTSEVARKLMRIKSRFRLLLTGTPLQNNLNELMGLLKFLMPRVFEEKASELEFIFKQQISTTTDSASSSRDMLLSQQRIARARSMLTPFILRRKKWQVLKDLPLKTRHVEYCDLTPEQAELYNQQLAKAWDIRERKSRGERIPADESSNVLIRLRQAAIHPLLFKYFYTDSICHRIAKTCPRISDFANSSPDLIQLELAAYADYETHDLCAKHKLLNQYMLTQSQWEISGKVAALLKLLQTFKDAGRRTLIFSQFVMVLDILEHVLTGRSIGYFRLDGSTKVEERQDMIDDFNSPACAVDVFMLSTKAGGAGINLASASRVVVFDSGFNPQDDVQAENRAHRIGQTQDVEVWRLITRGTVEEQIYDMGLVKLQLDQEVAGEAVDHDPGDETAATATASTKKPKPGLSAPTLSKAEQEGASKLEEMLFAKLEKDGQTPRKVHATAPSSQNNKLKLKLKGGKQTENGTKTQSIKSTEIKDESADESESPLTSLAGSDDSPSETGVVDIDVDEKPLKRGRRTAAIKAELKNRSSASRQGSVESGSQQSTISRSGRIVRRVK